MPRPIPEDTKYLMLELSRRFDLPVEALINRRHKHEATLRAVVARVLRDLGFSLMEIGTMLGRNHTTIMHLLNHNVDRKGEVYDVINILCKSAYMKRLSIRSAILRTPSEVKDGTK